MRRVLSSGLVCAAVALVAAGCGGPAASSKTSAGDAAGTIRSLGAVPIPGKPTAQATPTAGESHLQLLAMGDPVRAQLPGADAVVTAGGPSQDPIAKPGGGVPDRAVGTITVSVRETSGTLSLSAADFSSRDDHGSAIPLSAVGAASATARPGGTAVVTLRGTYRAGAAELTWRHDGKTIAVWDFNIELD